MANVCFKALQMYIAKYLQYFPNLIVCDYGMNESMQIQYYSICAKNA